MRLEPVARFLQSKGVATIGTDLFVNFIPYNVEGILLRDQLSGTTTTPELPGWTKGAFTLIVRAQTMERADELTRSAINALGQIKGYSEADIEFRYARVRVLPFSYAPTPGQNIELATQIDCLHIDTAYLPG